MAIKVPGILLATVTAGSADAFAQAEIFTGLANVPNQAYAVREIYISHGSGAEVDSAIYVSLTRRSKTAVPSISDADFIAGLFTYKQVTTSGTFILQMPYRIEYEQPIYIVEDPIYLQIDSDTTSAAQSASIRIVYDVVRVTEQEKLTLLARSLLTAQ